MFTRIFSLLVLLTFGVVTAPAAPTSYTERGQTDFDTAMPLLNPYGTWSKINEKWAYTPLDHGAPYTDGRWIYTEYGWYWQGNRPHSWVTEHFGYWKRGADKVWSWYPGPYWLPETVELRATSTHVGWRSAEVNEDGGFVERPGERYTKIDEWTFVTMDQFARRIAPGAAVADPAVIQKLLENSVECRHTYLTYREIDRPGPHPADFNGLGDGGMLAPKTLQDQLATQAKPMVTIPGSPTGATNSPATNVPGVVPPTLMGGEISATADKRKVKYWITMSLPTYWANPPADAKPTEIYLYRPDFFQDDDGIARRITLWFNPAARTSLKEVLAKSTLGRPDAESRKAEPEKPAQDPFHSPLDTTSLPVSSPPEPNASNKNPSATGAAPSGLKSDKAPIPPPYATNTPPANPQ